MSKAESVRESQERPRAKCESGTGALLCVCFQLKYNDEWESCNQVDFLRLQNILFTRVIRRFDGVQALGKKCNASRSSNTSICTISTHKCGFLLISCFLGVFQCLTRWQLSSFIFLVLLAFRFLSLLHSPVAVCVCRVVCIHHGFGHLSVFCVWTP